MPIKTTIDDRLLARAQRIGGFKTRQATLEQALREFVDRRRRLEMLAAFGTFDFEPGFNHKVLRGRPT
ncbi:MAG: type II toxin-antitoxin system VapB family antitoxin [Deltaproteobacteria bacterium]|nr:type II toxin-antitoxin system VapB family antitoxin [Deltaproteobacteria bacterium]